MYADFFTGQKTNYITKEALTENNNNNKNQQPTQRHKKYMNVYVYNIHLRKQVVYNFTSK